MSAKAPYSAADAGRHARGRGADRTAGDGRQRQRRVAEELRHVLAEILQKGECRDPVLRDADITVSEVRISPDLRNATAYVMPLGGANAAEIMAALTRSAGFLRGLTTRALTLRHAPKLTFALDETFDQADRIAALLARPEIERDRRARSDEAEAGDDDG
ncbi:MAG TPA: 30S ribosome-binding factor RbfA [Stellaceae bacterium]|nr:30S ribosome-binding factor RbfA [Stellaceae bacterium]